MHLGGDPLMGRCKSCSSPARVSHLDGLCYGCWQDQRQWIGLTSIEAAWRDGAFGYHPDNLGDTAIEICTNCGAYYTPFKGQGYYDTRCGRCG